MSEVPSTLSRPGPPVRRSSRAATILHLVLALGGWVLFLFFWFRVFYRTPPEQGAIGVLVIALLLVVCVSLTVAWIRHNLFLSRRFGERRSRVWEVRANWSRDKLGRTVVAPDWETLQGAGQVEVQIDPATGRKIYRAL